MADEVIVEKGELLALASDIVASYVGNNAVQPDQVTEMLRSVYGTMSSLTEEAEEEQLELIPAVPIKKSVTNDYIICLEDGKKLKMLKRHLSTSYNLTPEEYREKWGLKPDYPMVAPSYAQKRQELAKKIGLGRKPKTARTK
ncbi:MucR family transcriptional regulator [Algicella marina]|uniref:Transcriptional regulator n=1 Tax=Algicella marina TaxID=2683284 RepID=A0A6P1T0A0_9RHOB|nr:MucR family transcriptional regulator [Algicella marina]QHQ36158.1 transcriptional regulator [Algicella marina]